MQVSDVLSEQFARLPELVRDAVSGLGPDQLTWTPGPTANSIGWLVWHLARIQDHHVSEVRAVPQLWAEDGWAARFGLAADPDDTGWSHTPEQVAAVRPESADALVDYVDAVAARTAGYLATLTPEQLDEVVNRRWDPPVTLGVRLSSVLGDDLQHVGQAAYVRGLLP